MKRVEVDWLDSQSDSQWMNLSTALRDAEAETMLHHSVGFLIAETDGYVLLAMSSKPEIEGVSKPMVADTLQIPKVAVVALREWEDAA